MIAALAAATRLSPLAIKLAGGLALLVIVTLAVVWLRADAYRDGVNATDARWAEASARMQAAVVKATKATNALARQREAENAATIGDLRNEAARGTNDAVGPGVAGVLAKLRAEQGGGSRKAAP